MTTHVRRILGVIEQSYAERITLHSLGKMIDRQSESSQLIAES